MRESDTIYRQTKQELAVVIVLTALMVPAFISAALALLGHHYGLPIRVFVVRSVLAEIMWLLLLARGAMLLF